MKRRISELDFDAVVQTIASATDKNARRACDTIVQSDLAFVTTPTDAWRMLRNQLLIASVRHATSLDDVRLEQAIVQALVRTQHHPLAEPIPSFQVQGGLEGPDVSARLTAIVDDHPELTWDVDAVQRLIIRAIREHGDHALDDSQPPWLMHWGAASSVAHALIDLATLRSLGDIA